MNYGRSVYDKEVIHKCHLQDLFMSFKSDKKVYRY